MLPRKIFTLTVLVLLLCSALPASAVDLDTTATVNIVTGIGVSQASAMNFGDLTLRDGTVTISTAGALADPDNLSSDAANVGQGVFTLAAIAGVAYDITLAETVPAVGLLLNNFKINIDGAADVGGASPFTAVTLANASSTLNLGASLTVNSALASVGNNQTIGYRVSVNFN